MSAYKPYTIQKSDLGFMFVMPKDYRGINYILPFVSEELKAKSYKGYIIFDLLLSNGNNNSRYFQFFFDGQYINKETVTKIHPAPKVYQTLSNRFLKRNPQILNQGVLTKTDIEEIRESIH